MQHDTYIQNLLKKFTLNQCSKEEVDEVVQYIQGLTESTGLPTVEEVLAILDEKPMMNERDAIRIREKILAMPQKEENIPGVPCHVARRAASGSNSRWTEWCS